MSLLPAGIYNGKLVDAYLGAIGKGETPAMVLVFEIGFAAADGGWKAIDPVTRDMSLFMSEKAKEYAFRDLGKLGFNGNFDSPAFSVPMHEGCELEIQHETYEGKVKEKLLIGALQFTREKKAVNAETKRGLAAQWKQSPGAVRASPATPPASPASAPSTARPAGSPGSQGDPNEPHIPF